MRESVGNTFTEKRQVERKCLVFYPRVFNSYTYQVLGHVVNLSHRGIMLFSNDVIPTHEKYRLRIRLPNELCEHCELLISASSRWCEKDANPDFFLSGFQLYRLSSSAKHDISELLDQFSFAANEAYT